MATDREEEQEARQQGPQRSSQPRRRYSRRPSRKRCAFCQDKALKITYKRADLLQNYLTDRGRILPRRATGTCAKHQRELAEAIKRARYLAMLPYTAEHIRRV
ncbi:MAG: hypothetical protein AMJ93_13750 [Anaerolineae bacterium SM23_84]|nr:MAG: hypothetical protein AMJ93_13750 [Anaerolineae bacterium SM23_84]